jgi:hypothetical protein
MSAAKEISASGYAFGRHGLEQSRSTSTSTGLRASSHASSPVRGEIFVEHLWDWKSAGKTEQKELLMKMLYTIYTNN